MDEDETWLAYHARNACGQGAAIHGESTPGQWEHLAQWAGFETWADLLACRPVVPTTTNPHLATPRELAYAAIERRNIWDVNSRAYRARKGITP